MAIAAILAAELARQGISLNELARRADLSPGRVHAILTGVTPNPGILTTITILAALGKTLRWLGAKLEAKE